MGPSGSGEFPGQQGQALAHVHRKICCSVQVCSQTCDAVASLSTVSPVSRCFSLRPSCPVSRGQRGVRRQPRTGVPGPESFASPAALGHLHVLSALRRCGAGDPVRSPSTPPGPGPPGGGGVRIFSEDRRAASPFRCPPGRLVAPSRRQLEAGGPVCKLPAGGRGPPPAGIKARGGAPRRSRCLPGAGRALPPCARPAPALAARRLRVRTRGIGDPRQRRERRARLSRPFGPHGRRPGQRFLRWEPGNRRLRCALP